MLIDDDELEVSLSEHFRRAFHVDIVVDPIGRTIPLFVGSRPDPDSRGGEDRRSKTYRDRVRDVTIPLTEQGDGMRSFASVILHLLAPVTASVLLLDEPEAFLHPPQARLLGELIATKKPSRSQLFVATHSPDVLQGLVNVASDRLRLIRIQRDGDVNRVKELDKDLLKKIGNDPLMNYSSVMSGVFHERVIVCESDGDCMFYSSILDLDEVHGEGHPDVLFVHGSGKDRMATLAETLTALHVPVDVVADIDIVRDEEGMRKVITALDGDWTAIQPIARSVRTAIDNDKPMLSLDQIKQAIRKALDSVGHRVVTALSVLRPLDSRGAPRRRGARGRRRAGRSSSWACRTGSSPPAVATRAMSVSRTGPNSPWYLSRHRLKSAWLHLLLEPHVDLVARAQDAVQQVLDARRLVDSPPQCLAARLRVAVVGAGVVAPGPID